MTCIHTKGWLHKNIAQAAWPARIISYNHTFLCFSKNCYQFSYVPLVQNNYYFKRNINTYLGFWIYVICQFNVFPIEVILGQLTKGFLKSFCKIAGSLWFEMSWYFLGCCPRENVVYQWQTVVVCSGIRLCVLSVYKLSNSLLKCVHICLGWDLLSKIHVKFIVS